MVSLLEIIQIAAIGLTSLIMGTVVITYVKSDIILLRWYHASEVTQGEPELNILSELCNRAGIEVPRLYLIESPAINSFSIVKENRASLVLTSTAIDRFNPEELEVMMAHELAHINFRDQPHPFISVFAGAVAMLATAALWGALLTGFGQEDDPAPQLIRSYAMALVGPPAAAIIQLFVSRSREFEADDYSAGLCGVPILLDVLKYLDEQSNIEWQINPAHAHLFFTNSLRSSLFNVLFNTHPSLIERFIRFEGELNLAK